MKKKTGRPKKFWGDLSIIKHVAIHYEQYNELKRMAKNKGIPLAYLIREILNRSILRRKKIEKTV